MSCMEDLSHGFLTSRWVVHNWFMNLDNILDFLIGRMVSLGHRDGFPMMSALKCMVTYWTGPIVNHNVSLSSCHDFTKLLYCIVFQP